MQFRNVIGQQPVKNQLTEMIHGNRLSHALLFLGKEGVGALPIAIAYSQYIVCEKVNRFFKTETGPSLFGEEPVKAPFPTDACGECAACVKSGQLIHPDIHFSYPVVPRKAGDKPLSTDYVTEWRDFVKQAPYGNIFDWLQLIGAENKQGNITANECNDIIRKLSIKSFESEYKILILWMPEYLGNEGNKLLKLIEEPPANTLFILVAENESLILQTILSRTQLVRIPALELTEIESELTRNAGIPAVKARQLASVSEGNYREALQLLRHSGEDWQLMFRDWLNAIMKSGPVAQVKWIEEMSKLGREKQKQFLRYCNHLLEQSIRAGLMSGISEQIPENERDFVTRLNNLAGISQQEAIITEFDKASYYIERNANSKMLFHALTLKLYHIIADKSLILVH